jgi:DNA-binding HxlR family transcriptional regulator
MTTRSPSLREAASALADLFHHGWAPSVLAELRSGSGARVVSVVRAIGAPRDSVRRTLEALAERGLVRRDAPEGHPTRPEWVPTERGRRLAPACRAFLQAARRARAEILARRKWAVPVLFALLRGAHRFSSLGDALPGVTARALSATLREMEKEGLVTRRTREGGPPHVRYAVAPAARALAAPVRRLAALAPPASVPP